MKSLKWVFGFYFWKTQNLCGVYCFAFWEMVNGDDFYTLLLFLEYTTSLRGSISAGMKGGNLDILIFLGTFLGGKLHSKYPT